MSRRDISKIVATGSPKRKLLLVAEDTARAKYNLDRLLSDDEVIELQRSFTKSNEIALWNNWAKQDRLISNAITNLQGLKFEVLMHFSNLRGYILLWTSIENAELIVNAILHEIKDEEERSRLAAIGAKSSDIILSKAYPDEEGYLEIKVDFERDSYRDENGKFIGFKDQPKKTKEYSLWYVMNNVKKEATDSVIRFMSWRQAILDYMEEVGLNIKTYKDVIHDLTLAIHRPIVGWRKYQSDEESFLPDFPRERLDKLKGIYAVTPDLSKIEVDINIYSHFKKEFLGDEQ